MDPKRGHILLKKRHIWIFGARTTVRRLSYGDVLNSLPHIFSFLPSFLPVTTITSTRYTRKRCGWFPPTFSPSFLTYTEEDRERERIETRKITDVLYHVKTEHQQTTKHPTSSCLRSLSLSLSIRSARNAFLSSSRVFASVVVVVVVALSWILPSSWCSCSSSYCRCCRAAAMVLLATSASISTIGSQIPSRGGLRRDPETVYGRRSGRRRGLLTITPLWWITTASYSAAARRTRWTKRSPSRLGTWRFGSATWDCMAPFFLTIPSDLICWRVWLLDWSGPFMWQAFVYVYELDRFSVVICTVDWYN